VWSQGTHGGGDVGRAREISTGLIVRAERNQFTQWCKAALQFPAKLAVLAEEKNSHGMFECPQLATGSREATFMLHGGKVGIVTSWLSAALNLHEPRTFSTASRSRRGHRRGLPPRPSDAG